MSLRNKEIQQTAANVVVENAPPSECPNRYLEGLWQEKIIWNVTRDVLVEYLGASQTQSCQGVDVKQTLTWADGHETSSLTWYKPNTHPVKAGSVSKPDFGITQNDTHLINIESKNWEPNYKPLSLYQADKEIISRFRYLPSPNNILIISELNLEPADADEIWGLLIQNNLLSLILTHRKVENSYDPELYQRIHERLSAQIMSILKLGPFSIFRHKT